MNVVSKVFCDCGLCEIIFGTWTIMCIAGSARPEGLLESAWYEISEAKGNAFMAVLLSPTFFSTLILA